MGTPPLFLSIMAALLLLTSAQDCKPLLTFPVTSKLLSNCTSLSTLSAALHWTFHPSSATADIAFRAPLSSSGWIAWGLNPSSTGMVGTQALVAIRFDNGSTTAFTAPVTATYRSGQSPLQPGGLSYAVANIAGQYADSVMTIFATITLPGNATGFSHTWQTSTQIVSGLPGIHPTSPDNLKSSGSINLISGDSSTDAIPRLHRKNIHGVLNAVSWGILMPIGGIIARYLRVFQSADPAWFYLHVTCQFSAYVLGVAGWGLGLKLGSESPGLPHKNSVHRTLGTILFCFATLQVFALFLRPHKDNKYRKFWNVYHHAIGYAVIAISIVNILKGFDLLQADDKWKRAYKGVIIALGGVALVLEAFTWIVVLRRRSRRTEKAGAAVGNGYARSGFA